jgi:hypothetical protein
MTTVGDAAREIESVLLRLQTLAELNVQVEQSTTELQELREQTAGLRAKNQAAVGSGDAEAERIMDAARREATAIIEDARKRGAVMLDSARREVDALRAELEAIVARHVELLEQLTETRPAGATIN